ncbi:MAG: hypothetical protein ACP5MH_11530 [Thermoproteus sp.]
MKSVYVLWGVVALAIAAVLGSLSSGFGREAASSTATEVVLRGFIAAVVHDPACAQPPPPGGSWAPSANCTSRTDYFLQLENGTNVPLDVSNATFRVSAPVVGTGKAVYVRGYWRDGVFVAREVYE